MIVGTLRGVWRQANIRNSASGLDFCIVLRLYGTKRLAGLYTAVTVGVIMAVVITATITMIAKAWSSST